MALPPDLGYDDKLYLLALDHRSSFAKLFGVDGEASPQEHERVVEGKRLIFDAMVVAAEAGEDPTLMGVLVDEQYGAEILSAARPHGLKTAVPVERSGRRLFQFEYGEAFGEHIEAVDADFAKVLVRYNPDSPKTTGNAEQIARLQQLSDWCHANRRKFLFELLVPAEEDQLAGVDGDVDRYDAELRPELMRRAIEEFQQAGLEADIWKIEGVNSHADCVMLAEQTRSGGRDRVKCVLLGRGADDERVDAWLRAAAPVEGFIGFAIGRSVWSDVLKAFLAGDMERAEAVARIAANYTRFIEVYREVE